MDDDFRVLHDKLTDAFINYQWRIENPMPAPPFTDAAMIAKYRTDPVFHSKVQSLVAGVAYLVQDWLEGKGDEQR